METYEQSTIDLDSAQELALDHMLAGSNVFLTGKAGTGKTAVINELKRRCRRKLVLLAPTGMAAINIGGETIHHFLRIPVDGPYLNSVVADMDDAEMRAKLNAVDAILIDEVSMVNAYLLQELDRCFRSAASGKLMDAPFGGKQIIVCGDFFQLSPVVPSANVRKWMEELFGGVYAFMATAWGDAGFQAVELDQVHRQSDKEEIEILDALRIGKLVREFDMPISHNWLKEDLTVESCVDYLHRLNEICHRPGEPLPPGAVTLCARRNDASDINNERMRGVKGKDVLFRGSCGTGYPRWSYPTAIDMSMRIGARVVVLANSHDKGYVNGDMGTLLAANGSKATVFLDKGFEVTLDTFKWTHHTYEAMFDEDGKSCVVQIPVCHFFQTPLAPAYAMTIHKAQGMTLDAANIALGGGNCFSTGQLYTGVSRTRSLRNLSIDRPLREEDCIVDQKVVDFYNRTFPHKTIRPDED